MKKYVAGCLVIALLGSIVIGVGLYLTYRAAAPLVDDARSYLRGLSELGELDDAVANKAPFEGPASGELTDAQVQRFVRVQRHVRAELGQRFNQIEERYRRFRGNDPSAPRPSVADVINSLRDLSRIVVDARRYQVDAINKEGFSQAEYSWVRDRFYQAAGVEVANLIELQKVADAVREGTGRDIDFTPDRLPRPNVPAANRALVKPYLTELDDWIALAFFGL